MSRKIVAFSLPLLALVVLGARKPSDPKHENHYKLLSPPTTEGIAFALSDVQSQQQFVQVEGKVTNTTGDKVVIVKKGEAEFALPQGTMTAKAGGLFSGPLFLLPGDGKPVTWRAEADSGLHVDSFVFHPKGLSIAPNAGTPIAAPDFPLPASHNDFTAGPFSCTLKNAKQTTDNTEATFVCTYNGKGLGMVEASKIGIKEPGGKEYASTAKGKRDLLLPGDTTKVNIAVQIPKSVVDMQFATLQILWRDALAESPVTPVAVGDWSFELDPAKTAEANK